MAKSLQALYGIEGSEQTEARRKNDMSLIEKRLQMLHYRPRNPATPADGSCFFHAIVELLGWEPKFYKGLRSTLCDYMEQAGIVSII